MLVVRVKGYQKYSTWLTAYLLLVVLAVLTFLVVNGLGDGTTLFMVRGKGFRLVEGVVCIGFGRCNVELGICAALLVHEVEVIKHN